MFYKALQLELVSLLLGVSSKLDTPLVQPLIRRGIKTVYGRTLHLVVLSCRAQGLHVYRLIDI
jgi:hypothetical protein